MRWTFDGLPWSMLGDRPAMITLTYPGDWRQWCPDARTFVKHRDRLKGRWRREFGPPVGVWVAEFQPRPWRPDHERKAPHLHLYIGLPDQPGRTGVELGEAEYAALQRRTRERRHREARDGKRVAGGRIKAIAGPFSWWLRTQWAEVVTGNTVPAHHARGVDLATVFWSDRARDRVRRAEVADYFWRESGKWGQKDAPEDFGPLKFWDTWGGHVGFRPIVAEAELTEAEYMEFRRLQFRWIQARQRAAFGKAFGARSRGKDGIVVHGATKEDSLRALRWARETAAWKAEGHVPGARAPVRGRARFERREERRNRRRVDALNASYEDGCRLDEDIARYEGGLLADDAIARHDDRLAAPDE
jgi:hypothetical protein